MTLTLAAVRYAIEAHKGQIRKHTNEDYIHHPLRVAEGLLACPTIMALDAFMRDCAGAAAVLHDVREDCGVSFGELARAFNIQIANWVEEVTNPSRPSHGNRKIRKQIDLEHIAQASAVGASIKLIDIEDNVTSILAHDMEFATVYVPEKRAQWDVLKLVGDAAAAERVDALLTRGETEIRKWKLA